MLTVNQNFALYANLLLNGVQWVVTVIATFYVGNIFGRRTLYLLSGAIMAINCYLVAIGYLIGSPILIIIFMLIYMVTFGLVFSPVSWAYPVEIVSAEHSSFGNILTWVSLALTSLIPPIIINRMEGNAWPVFMFFAVYTTFSLIYMWMNLIETKGRKYQDFIK